MERLLNPFYQIALWLWQCLPGNWRKDREQKMKKRLRALHPGQRCSGEEYYARGLGLALAVLFWGAGLALLAELAAGDAFQAIETLMRPPQGSGGQETELAAFVEGETDAVTVPLKVSERAYTPEEIRKFFGEATAELEQLILGENASLEEVRTDLSLPESLCDGAVILEWMLSPTDVLDENGAVIKEVPETGELVELRAVMRCQGQEAEFTCMAHVLPPLRSEREELILGLLRKFTEEDEAEKYEHRLTLPDAYDGRRVIWGEERTHPGQVLIVLALGAALLLWARREQELKQAEKNRVRQMIMDYPEILYKLSMLLGAGETIRGAFVRIAKSYRKRQGTQIRYAYEEMLSACREMENGVGEAAAYEQFGRRCQDQRYVQLGSLLSRNLKKGTKGLVEQLEKEAASGMEERRNLARKLGEEAGTRLLFPMMLMLALVLVILVVPAVLQL